MIAEITMAVSAAKSAHAFITKSVSAGHSVLDLSDRIGKFYDSRDAVLAAEAANNQRKGLLSTGSVEAEALKIVSAKAQLQAFESELRELIMFTQGNQFYIDMIRERRKIKDARIKAAKAKAARKQFIINLVAISSATLLIIALIPVIAVALLSQK